MTGQLQGLDSQHLTSGNRPIEIDYGRYIYIYINMNINVNVFIYIYIYTYLPINHGQFPWLMMSHYQRDPKGR